MRILSKPLLIISIVISVFSISPGYCDEGGIQNYIRPGNNANFLKQNLKNEKVRKQVQEILRFHEADAFKALYAKHPWIINIAINSLRRHDDGLSWAVVEALEKIASPAVASVLPLLKDSDVYVRRWAPLILKEIKDAKALKALLGRLNEPDPVARERIVKAITPIADKSAVKPLTKTLQTDSNEMIRSLAGYALGRIKDPEVLPILISALQDPKAQARLGVCEGLGKIGIKAVPLLINKFTDEKFYVRKSASRALKMIGRKAVPSLIRYFNSRNPYMRIFSAFTYINITHKEYAVSFIIDELGNSAESVRNDAMKLLYELGHCAISPLKTGLKTQKDPNKRIYLVKTLMQFEDKEIIDAVCSAVNDPRDNVCISTLNFIRDSEKIYKIKDPRLDNALIRALRFHQNPRVRALAAQALGRFEFNKGWYGIKHANIDVINALLRAYGDSSNSVRDYSFSALRLIGRRALPTLEPNLKTPNISKRIQTAEILACISQDIRTIPILIYALKLAIHAKDKQKIKHFEHSVVSLTINADQRLLRALKTHVLTILNYSDIDLKHAACGILQFMSCRDILPQLIVIYSKEKNSEIRFALKNIIDPTMQSDEFLVFSVEDIRYFIKQSLYMSKKPREYLDSFLPQWHKMPSSFILNPADMHSLEYMLKKPRAFSRSWLELYTRQNGKNISGIIDSLLKQADGLGADSAVLKHTAAVLSENPGITKKQKIKIITDITANIKSNHTNKDYLDNAWMLLSYMCFFEIPRGAVYKSCLEKTLNDKTTPLPVKKLIKGILSEGMDIVEKEMFGK